MTPSFIIDCSMTMAWCFADEATKETAAVQTRMAAEAALVPAHWFLEVANVLIFAERKKRISQADADQFVRLLMSLDIQAEEGEASRAFDRVIPLCRAHSLTSYDAAYLDLAIRRGLPLATLDDDLRKAAKKAHVPLFGK